MFRPRLFSLLPALCLGGLVIGAAAGTLLGEVVQKASAEAEARDAVLDAEIGVSGGELGAPSLEHPPAKIGAFSGASAGVSTEGGDSPAEGPMQAPST